MLPVSPNDQPVNEEIIREITWNLCKQYDASNRRREKVHLANLVTTELERCFGAETENLYRQDWQDEVNLFAEKYGYSR